jgi:hypothetical protein
MTELQSIEVVACRTKDHLAGKIFVALKKENRKIPETILGYVNSVGTHANTLQPDAVGLMSSSPSIPIYESVRNTYVGKTRVTNALKWVATLDPEKGVTNIRREFTDGPIRILNATDRQLSHLDAEAEQAEEMRRSSGTG